MVYTQLLPFVLRDGFLIRKQWVELLSDKRKLSWHLVEASICFCQGLHIIAVQLKSIQLTSMFGETDSIKQINHELSLGIFHNFKHGNWSDLAGYLEDPKDPRNRSWFPSSPIPGSQFVTGQLYLGLGMSPLLD